MDNEVWFDTQSSFPDGTSDANFDEVGDYKHRSNNHELFFFEAETFVPHNLEDVIETFVKRHVALSFHRVREAIAANIISY